MSALVALGARARGLGLHLFTRPELEAMAGADEAGLVRALAASGKLLVPPAPGGLDLAVQQTAARHLATLRRWGPDEAVLEAYEAAADLRSLRALVRGAVQGAAVAARVEGLTPTRTLPVKLLEVLARQPTPARVAAHLFMTGHPDGARLSKLTRAKSAPELLALDRALVEGFAERASAAAARGDAVLGAWVRGQLDASNVATALVLAGAHEAEPKRWYVRGGEALVEADFVAAAGAPDPAQASARLQRALAKTALKGLVTLAGGASASAGSVERAAFKLALAGAGRLARLESQSCAPVLWFLLRLEAMTRDVRQLAHGAGLAAPRALVQSELVSP